MTNNTLIAVPDGSKQIYLIKQDEQVLTAAVQLTNGKIALAWEAITVSFSSGADGPHQQAMMIYIHLEDMGVDWHLICDLHKPLLLANGKYTIASKLRPGQSLVDKEGNGVPIRLVRMGNYQGGVHDISTIAPWRNSPDGHLVLAGGVVVGDFSMQIYFDQLPESLKEADDSAKPMLGTLE